MGSKRTQYRYFHNDNGTGFTLFNYKLNTGNAFVVLATADFNDRLGAHRAQCPQLRADGLVAVDLPVAPVP